MLRIRTTLALLAAALGVWTSSLAAQDTPATDKSKSELALRQGRIADKYARLEQLMLKMAEVDGAANPKRAALLKQAVQQSKDNLTRSQLEAIVGLLDSQKLKRAIDGQGQATTEMKALLELLLSENRADRNKGEQDRVKEYIQEVERLIRLQKDVEGRTAGGEKTDKAAQDQGKLADRTGDLSKKIEENEAAGKPKEQGADSAKPGAEKKPGEEPKPGETPMPMPPGEEKPEPTDAPKEETKPGETPMPMPPGEGPPMPGEPKPGEQKPPMPGEQKPGEPMPGEPKPGEPMPGQPMPMPGQPMPMSGEPMPGEAKPGETKPGETPPAPENPARKRLQQAEQKMRDAQKKLEEAKRDDAKAAQEAARQELEKAKAELEEILRQLREEEIERTLAQLEARFRKMLEMQVKVLDATRRLESVPVEARGREVDIESGKLAVEERKIVLEADKAYNLLLEEGSSIAFPESVEQMRGDMEQVANRLAKTNLDPITVGLEEEIVSALNEMIKAMQQAQKDKEKEKEKEKDGKPMPGGEEQEQPLVDRIAELKMIKSMQLRVNERTQRFSKLIASPDDLAGQVTDGELRDAVEKLGERQSKLQRITRDIVLGKNQ